MLIPYAGYDPDEDDMENLAIWRHYYKRHRKYPLIDGARARRLFADGMSAEAIGEYLADEARRPVPFLPGSVRKAMRRSC
jgi:hypothetical protein